MRTVHAVEDSCIESIIHPTSQSDDWIIHQAIALLERRIFSESTVLGSPSEVRDYLRLKLTGEPNEVFAVIFLDSRHRVLSYEELFQGTINQTAVYPRVVVQRALATNAAAVILAHQHPSRCIEPSLADRTITSRLKSALELVDIQVLDHFIIGKGEPCSFAETGLL